jgi:hypothetical protein
MKKEDRTTRADANIATRGVKQQSTKNLVLVMTVRRRCGRRGGYMKMTS